MAESASWHSAIVREIALSAASLVFVSLVGVAVAGSANSLLLSIVATTAIATAFMRWLFPERPFFSLTFANLIAVYVAVFAFFIEEIFGHIQHEIAGIGFSLPILFFLGGCWIWRATMKDVVDHPRIRDEHALFSALAWLLPVFAVGASVLILSIYTHGAINTDIAFLCAMTLIAAIVFAVSRNVALFLVDAGLLFEEFFHRMSRLAIPAFAFLTFYSLLVIVFASLYCILSQNATLPHFRITNIPRAITFSESIHFSIVTISTVGYGDIVPISNLARALSSVEVICGVLLLLFGVSELLEYTREHRLARNDHRKQST
jgi:voltage-gated potassium channel